MSRNAVNPSVNKMIWILITFFLCPVYCGLSHAAEPNSSNLESIRKGDVLVNRLALNIQDGGRSDEMEATSFEAFSSKPVLDKCHFEIVQSQSSWAGQNKSFPVQLLSHVRLRTDVPDFDMIGFLEQLRPSADLIFTQIVDIDELTGPVFKREDLNEKVRVAFLEVPYTQLPTTTKAWVQDRVVEHVSSYWTEVRKQKNKPMDELKGLMADARAQRITKLTEDIRNHLRDESKGKSQVRPQNLKSDQLTKTMVALNFKFKESTDAAESRIECWFEGDKTQLTLQRLNAVIGPHFELMSRERYLREEVPAPGKKRRNLATDGDGLLPK